MRFVKNFFYNFIKFLFVYNLVMCVCMLTVYQLFAFTALLLTLRQYYTCKRLSNQNIEILIVIPKIKDR